MVGDAADLEILEYLSCGMGAISFTKISFKFWWMGLQSLVIFLEGDGSSINMLYKFF